MDCLNSRNYAYNLLYMLGGGRGFVRHFRAFAGREMGLAGMAASTRAERIFAQNAQLQILHVVLGKCRGFAIFVLGDRAMDDNICTDLFNPYNERVMVTAKIGRHTVEYYDAIDELPIVRFHKYQKLLLVDAGVGSDINAFDQRIEKARRFIVAGKPEQAQQELENLRQCVYLIQSGLSPKHRAFAALVTKIDGKECTDIGDDALARVTEILNDVPEGEMTALLDAVKKKIDDELMLYFPSLFNDSDVKEYYDLLRKRTMEILNAIIEGRADPMTAENVEKLTTELITYSHPKLFTGSDGVEIQFDRQFENLCLVLSEQLHVEPKRYSVLEFYNAFDFVKERAKQMERAQKRQN